MFCSLCAQLTAYRRFLISWGISEMIVDSMVILYAEDKAKHQLDFYWPSQLINHWKQMDIKCQNFMEKWQSHLPGCQNMSCLVQPTVKKNSIYSDMKQRKAATHLWREHFSLISALTADYSNPHTPTHHLRVWEHWETELKLTCIEINQWDVPEGTTASRKNSTGRD